jgi:hypothetical protein
LEFKVLPIESPSSELGSYTSTMNERNGKMAGFEYYIIYGNPKEGATNEDYEKFGKAIEKLGLKMKFWGGPFGVSEGAVITLKGPISAFEKLMADSETYALIPVTNNRTVSVYTM